MDLQFRREFRLFAKRLVPTVLPMLGSVKSARTEAPVVSLTFDDGPHPSHTPGILDVLARHGSKATFFMIANRAASYPELVARVVSEGHEVGLHGMDHLPAPMLGTKLLYQRLREGRRALEEIAGIRVGLYRPPYGVQTPRTFVVARACGMEVVGFTAVCEDWEDLDPREVASRGANRIGPGGILLLHDFYEPDVLDPIPGPTFDRALALDMLMHNLRDRGLSSRTVTELIREWPAEKTLWFWWKSYYAKRRSVPTGASGIDGGMQD